MSELEFEYKCSQLEAEATENLFANINSKTEQDTSGISKRNEKLPLDQELEQVLRRQSIVFEGAQKQVAVLENLLKNVEPGWQKVLGSSIAPQHCPPPQAYHFKDIYELRKQKLLLKCLEQERAQRQFRSRPMPNFSHAHQQLANRPVVHHITCAITPNVLKESRNMLLRRQQKIEQLRQQRDQEQLQLQKQRPKTKPVPKYNVSPLKPANIQVQLEVKPFRFYTEKRAEQRKIFNALSNEAQEVRRIEQEQQRKRLEEEEYQKKRQLTNFRARPNPFKYQFSRQDHRTI